MADKPDSDASMPHTSAPMSEEYLRSTSVGGEPVRLNCPIQLVEYDPEWPRLFETLARGIRTALAERVLLLEHAGSTSVPGLAAKPIIDIDLVVADSSDEASYISALERIGYVLRIREPDWYEHRMLKYDHPNANLHVFSLGCPEVERMLLFRDWLRAHDEDCALYERTKRALASREWAYVQGYADAKGDVVAAIIARARAARDGDSS